MVQRSNALALPAAGASDLQARELLAALPVAVYTTDPAGLITAYNDAAVKLWGVRPILGEARWCGSARLFHPDGRPMAHEECPMALALRDGKDVPGAEAVAERPDGSRVPFLAFPVVLRDATGAVTGAVNTLVDVTEQKQVQEARSRLAAIVDSSADAIISKDLNGIVRTWNGGAARVFGYGAEEMIGMPVTTLIPEDRLAEEEMILERIRQGEVVDHFETVRRARDGRLLPISLTISPIMAEDGRIVGASKIARDISAQKEAEDRIRALMRELNHRVKNQFAVILSMARGVGKQASSRQRYDSQIEERILALSRSHDLLVQGEWKGAMVSDLLLEHLRPFGAEDAIALSGPTLFLHPLAVQYLGIAFHELATNSAKYGALKNAAGKLAVDWSVERDEAGEERFALSWTEDCGRRIASPTRAGYGSMVLERVVPSAVGGVAEISYAQRGLIWHLHAPRPAVDAACLSDGDKAE